MKNFSRILLGPAAVALVLSACSGEKADVAKTNNAPSDQVQAQTSYDQSASSSLDPGTITFTAVDIDGVTRQATQWVGKQPVVINFWGTWCPPCRKEIPDLVRFYDEYKPKGLEIVSLAVNDNPDAVRSYAANAGMQWVMLMGDDGIYQKYGGIRGVPTTIFIDRNGKEVKRMVGAASYEDFKAAADMII
jgi:thiol-disulfide isomerase/thioredoxin